MDDNVIVLADIATGKPLQRWWRLGRDYVCDTSPTTDLLLIENGTNICQVLSLAAVRAGKVEETLLKFADSSAPRCLSVSPDGTCFAAVHGILEPAFGDDGAVKPNVKLIRNKGLAIFSADTFETRMRIVNDDLLDCTAIAVSPAGKWIATGHQQGVVRICRR